MRVAVAGRTAASRSLAGWPWPTGAGAGDRPRHREAAGASSSRSGSRGRPAPPWRAETGGDGHQQAKRCQREIVTRAGEPGLGLQSPRRPLPASTAARGRLLSPRPTATSCRVWPPRRACGGRFLCRHCTASSSAGQLPPLGGAFQPTCVLPGGARDIGGDDVGGVPVKAAAGPPWWSWDRHARRLPARHVAALRALAPR